MSGRYVCDPLLTSSSLLTTVFCCPLFFLLLLFLLLLLLPPPPSSMSEIVMRGAIGTGSYGEVYRAEVRGKTVAVKKLHVRNLKAEQVDAFCKEASLMCQLNHTNIVGFIGAVTEPSNLCIITQVRDETRRDEEAKRSEARGDTKRDRVAGVNGFQLAAAVDTVCMCMYVLALIVRRFVASCWSFASNSSLVAFSSGQSTVEEAKETEQVRFQPCTCVEVRVSCSFVSLDRVCACVCICAFCFCVVQRSRITR